MLITSNRTTPSRRVVMYTSDCTIVTSGHHGSIRTIFISNNSIIWQNNSITQKTCDRKYTWLPCLLLYYYPLVDNLVEVLRITHNSMSMLYWIIYDYLYWFISQYLIIPNIWPLTKMFIFASHNGIQMVLRCKGSYCQTVLELSFYYFSS